MTTRHGADEAGADLPTLSAVLSQHADLTKEFARHDAAIETMSDHIGRVDAAVTTLAGDVRSGFAEIGKQLARADGQKGPSVGSIMGLVALGGSIVSMTAASITFLVLGIVSPDITTLKVRSGLHQAALEQMDRDIRDDYRDLKREVRNRLYDRLDRLDKPDTKLSWAPNVQTEPPKR